MIINSVIFDFNGTLFKDSIYHKQAWLEIAEKYSSLQFSLEDIEKSIIGLRNIEVLTDIFKLDYPLSKLNEISSEKEAVYRDIVRDNNICDLVDGACEFFDSLKDNDIPFTIASASIPANIDFFFEHFHLDKWFDRNLIICDDGTYSNKNEMYLEAMKVMNFNKDEVVIVEDSTVGYQSAIQSGSQHIILISDTPEEAKTRKSLDFVDLSLVDFKNIQNHFENM